MISAELLAQKASIEKWLEENPHPYLVPEGTEEDQRGTEREKRVADHDLAQEKSKDLISALDKINKGTYGNCLNCRGEIADARLLAYPTAKRCMPCQKKYDKSGSLNRRK